MAIAIAIAGALLSVVLQRFLCSDFLGHATAYVISYNSGHLCLISVFKNKFGLKFSQSFCRSIDGELKLQRSSHSSSTVFNTLVVTIVLSSLLPRKYFTISSTLLALLTVRTISEIFSDTVYVVSEPSWPFTTETIVSDGVLRSFRSFIDT